MYQCKCICWWAWTCPRAGSNTTGSTSLNRSWTLRRTLHLAPTPATFTHAPLSIPPYRIYSTTSPLLWCQCPTPPHTQTLLLRLPDTDAAHPNHTDAPHPQRCTPHRRHTAPPRTRKRNTDPGVFAPYAHPGAHPLRPLLTPAPRSSLSVLSRCQLALSSGSS